MPGFITRGVAMIIRSPTARMISTFSRQYPRQIIPTLAALAKRYSGALLFTKTSPAMSPQVSATYR